MSTFIGMGVNKTADKKDANVTKLEKENNKLLEEVKELTEKVETLTNENAKLETQVKELTEKKAKKSKEE